MQHAVAEGVGQVAELPPLARQLPAADLDAILEEGHRPGAALAQLARVAGLHPPWEPTRDVNDGQVFFGVNTVVLVRFFKVLSPK